MSVCAARNHSRAEFEQEVGVCATLQKLAIPLHLLEIRGESPLVCDSGRGAERLLMFGARRHVPLFLRGAQSLQTARSKLHLGCGHNTTHSTS